MGSGMITGGNLLVYSSGECEIDIARHKLRVLGSEVPIGRRAFEIIQVLVESAGQLITKDELLSRIWPDTVVLENTLQVHAVAIRKALGPCRELLKTESGRGYRLLGNWTVSHHPVAQPPAEPRQMVAPEALPAANFPAGGARLIGRAVAVQELRDLISAYRVVTLTGPGGIGKSTLALNVARGIRGEFGGGGWLVELATLTDPGLLPSAVARALGCAPGGEPVSAETVAQAIGGQKLLLLLDNCEHVIEAAATLADTFLRRCPHVTILTTTLEALRIQGEHIYRVPPLEAPAPGQQDPEHILAHGAVQLFIDRTTALRSDFSLQNGDLAAIAAICRRLDGIPLAIEFAAARAATLGLHAVAAHLDDRFGLLTVGRRMALPRQRTLRAMLDWSYELLPEPERLLLRRLSLFSAGFTLEAATAVVRDRSEDVAAVIAGIANLVGKSLVVPDGAETPARWRLPETIRAYALEKLGESGDSEAAFRLQGGAVPDLTLRR